MKSIILCAGFGTRLNQITQGKYPKALIKIGEKTILDLLTDNLNDIPEIDEIVIVSNNKYFDQLKEYGQCLDTDKIVTVINDGTNNNDERRGAVGDIDFALKEINYHGDTMVLCADNWFDFKLSSLYSFHKAHNGACVVFGKQENDEKLLRAGGVAVLGKEKPKGEIEGNFAVGPFYIFNSKATSLFDGYCKRYAGDHTKIDAPGNYPSFLASEETNCEVYAYDIEGYHCIDMGTPEQYEKAQNIINQTLQIGTK